MAKALKTAGMIYAMGMMIFAAFFYFAGRSEPPEAQAADERQPHEDVALAVGASPLFPGLDPEEITAITLYAPDSSFSFEADGLGSVSVNDRLADAEVYMTLVSQIMELPVSAVAAFNPEEACLTLTLTVSEGSTQHIARFYEDDGTREMARIIAGSPEAPIYGETNGWRVGTLLMTCEGTRIQDERGNERPAAFSTVSPDRP